MMLLPAWHVNYAAFPCRNLVDGSTAVARMGRTEFWNSEHGRRTIHLLLPHILDLSAAALVIELVFVLQRSKGRIHPSIGVAKSL